MAVAAVLLTLLRAVAWPVPERLPTAFPAAEPAEPAPAAEAEEPAPDALVFEEAAFEEPAFEEPVFEEPDGEVDCWAGDGCSVDACSVDSGAILLAPGPPDPLVPPKSARMTSPPSEAGPDGRAAGFALGTLGRRVAMTLLVMPVLAWQVAARTVLLARPLKRNRWPWSFNHSHRLRIFRDTSP
jgi:hypothetical protein